MPIFDLQIFIGQIGRDVQHVKQTQSILQLLWDVSHLQSMPKHLVEKALSEQLAILTEMTMVSLKIILLDRFENQSIFKHCVGYEY